MKKKFQIFVSSTFEDMKMERQAAVEAILHTGHIPAGMELFATEDNSQLDIIKRWIKDSDIFLIMLGGRYGSIEPKSHKSYIHLEYEYARSINIPIISLVISDSYLLEKINKGQYDLLNPEYNLKTYKELYRVLRSKLSKEFNDCKDIEIHIRDALNTINTSELKGWVKYSDFIDREQENSKKYLDVLNVSIGYDRDKLFRELRDRAQKSIEIIGIGMNKISKYALKSLERESENVPIDLYMFDPLYLEYNDEINKWLEEFLGINYFRDSLHVSFETLKKFCAAHNLKAAHKISLYVYNSLPSYCMMIADKDFPSMEIIVEFLLNNSGEERPLLCLHRNNNRKNGLIDILEQKADILINNARKIV